MAILIALIGICSVWVIFNYQEGNKEAIWVAQYDYEGRISNTGGGGVVSWGSAPAKMPYRTGFCL